MKGHNLQYKTRAFKIRRTVMFCLFVPLFGISGFPNDAKGKDALWEMYDSASAYYADGMFSRAIRCLDSIFGIKQGYEGDVSPEYYKVFNWYGVSYRKMGFLKKAVSYYEKTLEYPIGQKNRAMVLMNIANVYTQKSDFSLAITYYNKVLSIISDLGETDQLLLAKTYYNMGKAYGNSAQDALALKCFLLSEETRKMAGLPADGETILDCATSFDKLGKKDSANLFFKRAVSCFEEEYGTSHYSTAFAYMNYAKFLVGKEDYGKALGLYNKSLGILDMKVSEKHTYKSYCYQNLGELYDRLKDYKLALSYYQKSLTAKVYGFNDTSIYSNPANGAIPDIKMLYLLKRKALTFEKLSQVEDEEKNLLAAMNTLELNVRLMEQLRGGYLYESTKLKLSQNEDGIYKGLVRIAAKLYKKTGERQYAEAAFKYSEQGKYGVLREFYNEEARMKAAFIPDSLCEKQKAIRERLNSLSFQIEDENSLPNPDMGKLGKLRESLFGETQELESLSRGLEKDYPQYRKGNKVTPIKAFQAKLHEDQVALAYTVSDSNLHTFLVTRDTFRLCHSSLDSTFFSALRFYRGFLTSEGYLNHDTFRISAYCIYQKLLQPFEKEIKGHRLLIIPDGMLSLISFDALVDEPFDKGNNSYYYPTEPYIIRKYPIGYAFSASLFVESFSIPHKRGNRTLAIAPDYRFPDGSVAHTPFLRRHLIKLALFHGDFYDRGKATESNFKKTVPRYGIVHIYAHGQEDIGTSSRSWIRLEADSLNDGLLYANEVGNLMMDARLVVLASCYSGSGKVSKGEGVLSMGRSFLSTGASSILMSQWATSLEAVTEQAWTFQKNLLMGRSKDKALQLSKLKYLENKDGISGHPKVWDSLIIAGNQEPLYNPYILLGKILGAMVFIGFLTLFFIRIIKKAINR